MNARLTQLLALLETEPDDAFLQYALALEFRALGQKNDAIETLRKLLLQHPGYLPAYYPLGEMLLKENMPEKAENIIKQGIGIAQIQNDRKTEAELGALLQDSDE